MKPAGTLNKIALRRGARMVFLLAAFLFLATIVAPGPPPPPAGPAQAVVMAMPVPLDPDDPRRRRVGDLLFLRGWSLSSDEARFGGISAMQIERQEVTAISDAGVILQFGLPRAPGPQPLRIVPLPQSAGANKLSRDSEAMLVRGRNAWIAFEQRHRVARLSRRDWHEQNDAQPVLMRRWRPNSGAEAMVRLADGRFLVFAEGPSGQDPFSAVILFDGDPAEVGTRTALLRYRRLPGFRITDAALLPDGRLLLLNRRGSWLVGTSARLVIAKGRGLRAGATIEGREIAELRPPLTVDNMEALSVTREGGQTVVRIASDDNFMAIQRTLLLEFALVEAAP